MKAKINNSKEIFNICNSVKNNIRWYTLRNNEDKKFIKHIEKTYNFKFIDKQTLLKQIDFIKSFDSSLLWNKEFMGLKKHESICAVSCEITSFMNNIIGGYYDDKISIIN